MSNYLGYLDSYMAREFAYSDELEAEKAFNRKPDDAEEVGLISYFQERFQGEDFEIGDNVDGHPNFFRHTKDCGLCNCEIDQFDTHLFIAVFTFTDDRKTAIELNAPTKEDLWNEIRETLDSLDAIESESECQEEQYTLDD